MFSPLATTKSMAWRSRKAGSSPSSVRRPRPPTMSPTKRMVGAVGTSHTLAQGGHEQRAPHRVRGLGRSRPAGRRAPAGGSCRREGRRPALDPARRAAADRHRALPRRQGGGGRAARVHGRRGDRADPQPDGDVPAAAPVAARPVDPRRLPRPADGARRRGRAAGQPRCRPSPEVRRRRAEHRRRRQRPARRPAGLLRSQGHQRRGQAPGRDRAADAAGEGRRRDERHRGLRRPDPQDGGHSGAGAAARDRLVGVHAHLRRADRRHGALGHAARRRHGGR